MYMAAVRERLTEVVTFEKDLKELRKPVMQTSRGRGFKVRGENKWKDLEARDAWSIGNIKGTGVAGTEGGQQKRRCVHRSSRGQIVWSPPFLVSCEEFGFGSE